MAATKKVEKNGRIQWRVSWYDALGQRHQKFFASKADAEQHRADVTKASRQRLAPRVDPNITVKDYAARWLPQHATEQDLKHRTIESYAATLRLHILPVAVGAVTFGDLLVATIRRPLVKALLRRQREQGYSRDSVRITLAVLSAMLEEAVEDDLLVANPAHRLRKKLRLSAFTMPARKTFWRSRKMNWIAPWPPPETARRSFRCISRWRAPGCGSAKRSDSMIQIPPCSISTGAGYACSVSSAGGASSVPRNRAMGVTSISRRTSLRS